MRHTVVRYRVVSRFLIYDRSGKGAPLGNAVGTDPARTLFLIMCKSMTLFKTLTLTNNKIKVNPRPRVL